MTFSGNRWLDLPAHNSAVAETGETITVHVSYYLHHCYRRMIT